MEVGEEEKYIIPIATVTTRMTCIKMGSDESHSLNVSLIDDLRKCRHAVSAYRHGLYIYIYRSRPAGVAQSRRAFVGGTVSTWAR